MESPLRIFLFSIVMVRLSAAEEVKKNLIGAVGGNLTFLDPVLEFGFLLKGRQNLASINYGKLQIFEEIYMNKLHWSKTSGLFMITDLQRSDSGIYTIDSKKGKVFYTSYNLTVYDHPPTPAVENLTVSSEICWLLCSVDNLTSLRWYKDEEILNQSSSAFSLSITVHRQDRYSSYRCVAANPAGNKTFHVDVRTSCGFNETESSDHQRYYGTIIPVVISFLLAVLVIFMVKWKFQGTKATRPTKGSLREGHYMEVQMTNRTHEDEPLAATPESCDHSQTTVYAKLKLPEVTLEELGGPSQET